MNNQNNNIEILPEEDILPEYDFTKGVRGKHYQQYQKGHSVTIHYEDGTTKVEHFPPQNNSDVIILDPDVKKYFPDSESVNSTLRSLIKLIPQ